MILYIVQWGYHSSNDGGSELDSIWTQYDKAIKYILDEVTGRHLEKKNAEYWTDGDYWISLSKVNSDTRSMYGES